MTSSDAQEPPPIRASDAERQAAVTVLHDALARGLLTVEECDARMTAAYAARFVRELPPLTADLPPAPAAAPTAPGWRPLAVLAWLQVRAALSGVSWRGSAQTVRARPRLALAAVALLALLSIAAVSAGPVLGDGGPARNGSSIERMQHVGPH